MLPFKNSMYHYARIGFLAGTVSLFLSTASMEHNLQADAPAGEEVLDIKFSNGHISAKIRNSPLEKVLKEIMSQSGARIWLSDSIEGTVTVEFQNIPIGEGVRRILKDKNYAFAYALHETREGKLAIISASKSKEIYTPAKEADRKSVV